MAQGFRIPEAAMRPSGLVEAAALGAALLVAALGTALAGHHLSRAHGTALAVHALAGVVGLLFALAAVVFAGRHARGSQAWTRLAVGAALVALGISLVDVAMLGWYAVARLLAA
jgi:hypothetical protein